MALTDIAVRNAKPKDKPYKKYDVDGLYIVIRGDAKTWRFKYYMTGKERHVTFSPRFPELSVRNARLKAAEARELIAQGIDPADKKQKDKRMALRSLTGTFSCVMEDWYSGWSRKVTLSTLNQMRSVIDNHLIPKIGTRPVAGIEPPDFLEVLRNIETNAGQDQAHRARRVCESVMYHAIGLGFATRNPVLDIKKMLTPIRNEHYLSVVTPKEFGEILYKLWEYTDLQKNGWPHGPTPFVAYALRALPYLALRPGEVRNMKWDWIKEETLIIPPAQMKMKKEFHVPLSRQVLEILKEIKPLTGNSDYVFSGRTCKVMASGSINSGLIQAGIGDQTKAHGFRASFRTLTVEELDADWQVVERCLAHTPPGALADTYDRAQFLSKRRVLMQNWADYIDESRKNAAR